MQANKSRSSAIPYTYSKAFVYNCIIEKAKPKKKGSFTLFPIRFETFHANVCLPK